MARGSRRSLTARALSSAQVRWFLVWVLLAPITWPLWWIKELSVGFALGAAEGIFIGIHELFARRILARWEHKNISLYNQPIWELLRRICFDKFRTKAGSVICQRCLVPTFEPHCHHVQWVARRPDLAFTPGNLSPRCFACHQAEHPTITLIRGRAA